VQEYFWDIDKRDTVGYDAETGYGMLRGGETLEHMLPPYEMRHYKIGASFTTNLIDTVIDPFFILAPWYYKETPLLTPTSDTALYYAERYRIQQKVELEDLGLENWVIARSWGRGGRGTIGWSGVQPMDGESNVQGNPSGWCRVFGDAMPNDINFNYDNIRDISFRTDTITLETFCYLIFDKATNDTIGWFPVPPDSVVYRFTIWGALDTTLGINDEDFRKLKFNIKCKAITNPGQENIAIDYEYEKPDILVIQVYNSIGNLIFTDIIDKYTNDGRIDLDFSMYSSGAYYVVLKTKSEYGFCNFIYNP